MLTEGIVMRNDLQRCCFLNTIIRPMLKDEALVDVDQQRDVAVKGTAVRQHR